MGRTRKSNSKKELQGTGRSDRQRTPKLSVLDGYPEPSAKLNKDEQEIYNALCKHLDENGALMEADAFLCTMFAQSMHKYLQAAYKCRGNGTIQVYKNGTRQVSPEYTVFKDERANLLKMGKLLGLDPKARLELEYFQDRPQKAKDEFAELMNIA